MNNQIAVVGNETAGFAGSRSIETFSPKGRLTGTKYFMGAKSARELRAAGKAIGLKGDTLTKWVNGALSDEAESRKAVGAATLSALCSKGLLPDVVKVSASGTSASMTFTAPKAIKVPAPVVVVDESKAALESQVAELLAKLAALDAK